MRDTGALEDRIEQLTKVQRGTNDGLNKLDNKCKADGTSLNSKTFSSAHLFS